MLIGKTLIIGILLKTRITYFVVYKPRQNFWNFNFEFKTAVDFMQLSYE